MLIIALLLVIIVLTGSVLLASNRTQMGNLKHPTVYRYGRKAFFMDRAEHEFFDILTEAIGSGFYVFPQVHLSTILEHKVKGQNWRAAFSSINGKSVDFVVCDKSYIRPLLAIELDGRSHASEAVRQRDAGIERIFEGANLRLLRFANHGSPNKEEVKQRVSEALSDL